MSRFDKHLGQGKEIDFEGEKVLLKPLDVEYLPHFFKIMKSFSGANKDATIEETLKNLNDDGMNSIKIVIKETLKRSLPEESDEIRDVLGLKFMSDILNCVIELNTPKTDDSSRKEELIKKMQASQSVSTK